MLGRDYKCCNLCAFISNIQALNTKLAFKVTTLHKLNFTTIEMAGFGMTREIGSLVERKKEAFIGPFT